MQTMSETIEVQSPICNPCPLICPFEPTWERGWDITVKYFFIFLIVGGVSESRTGLRYSVRVAVEK